MYRDNARGRGVIFDLTYGSHRDQRFPSDALAKDDVIVVTRVKKVNKWLLLGVHLPLLAPGWFLKSEKK